MSAYVELEVSLEFGPTGVILEVSLEVRPAVVVASDETIADEEIPLGDFDAEVVPFKSIVMVELPVVDDSGDESEVRLEEESNVFPPGVVTGVSLEV